ncbi:3-methyladenine DNA glycosylase [Raineyella fluvialis]|uniref:3-methyladenine DNA glycosylase n=1 Tax=Raineyella fluvialis TaxID=2662261 RepID=A0A5Q2FFM1_9ACTN|nr:3-methyladenine DNA glycosylase [Raineyella fluvialis]
MIVLPEDEWRSRVEVHEMRVDERVAGHRWRAERGIAHPVDDFLWQYYRFRPADLRRWHPGHGVVLAGNASDVLTRPDYHRVEGGVALDSAAVLERRASTVRRSRDLLTAVMSRPGRYGCFGMHEWAMVHGAGERRHPLPLRLGQRETDRVVEELGARCTHVDAYRFFTPSGRPLNDRALTREDQLAYEQPGCLHANMDLYRIAYKLSPLVDSGLVFECFELARAIRDLDMAASPYDVSGFGIAPVPVETAAGRATYVTAQRAFQQRAEPLRRRLLTAVDGLLTPQAVDPLSN